jgi:hypothetical protein
LLNWVGLAQKSEVPGAAKLRRLILLNTQAPFVLNIARSTLESCTFFPRFEAASFALTAESLRECLPARRRLRHSGAATLR